jgi:hypothetical protein
MALGGTHENIRDDKGFQASFAGRTGSTGAYWSTGAKLAGVRGASNRTNLPAQAELLFQENGPGAVFLTITLE